MAGSPLYIRSCLFAAKRQTVPKCGEGMKEHEHGGKQVRREETCLSWTNESLVVATGGGGDEKNVVVAL